MSTQKRKSPRRLSNRSLSYRAGATRERERERDKQTDRQTDRQRDRERETERQRQRDKDRDKDRETKTETDRDRVGRLYLRKTKAVLFHKGGLPCNRTVHQSVVEQEPLRQPRFFSGTLPAEFTKVDFRVYSECVYIAVKLN